MRKQLEQINGVRSTFTGTFVRLGLKKGWKGVPDQTVLLKDIRDITGKKVASHVWMNFTTGFDDIVLNEGDRVIFDARVKEYIKGYQGQDEWGMDGELEIDYRLSHPTKVNRLAKTEMDTANNELINTSTRL
jgi:hypothetical protein